MDDEEENYPDPEGTQKKRTCPANYELITCLPMMLTIQPNFDHTIK